MHEAVIEAGQPELFSGSDATKRALVLGEYGHPTLLPGGEWTAVENNDRAATRLPAPGVDVCLDRVEVESIFAELVAGNDSVLQLGKTVE